MPRAVRFNGNQKPESDFKKAAWRYLQIAYGRHIFRLSIAGGPFQRSGSPDDIFSIRGNFVAIEWKAPKESTGRTPRKSPRQDQVIAEIIAAGGRAGKVSNWMELKALLEGIEPMQRGMEL